MWFQIVSPTNYRGNEADEQISGHGTDNGDLM
jgi:hypothetical protein